MIRRDFLYPFAIDAASGQAAQTDYASHVEQMIQQILFTDPGERVCLPTFGAGLRRLLFAPLNASLDSATKLLVMQSLNEYLGDQITVQDVTVTTATSATSSSTAISGPPLPDTAIAISITYVLIETQTVMQTQLQVS
jgi:hypothetical protein